MRVYDEEGSTPPRRDTMSEAKILTKEIVEWVVADGRWDGFWSLSEFTAIEDVAAESLSKHQGELDLDRLSKHAALIFTLKA